MILKLDLKINIKHYWTIQIQISLKLGKTSLKSKLGIILNIGLKLNEISIFLNWINKIDKRNSIKIFDF